MPLPPIIHEDPALLAFNKPAGMWVASDRTDKKQSAGNLMALVQEKFGSGVANVHRLDADTSGVVVCARNKIALDYVSGQFQSKSATRVFQTLVVVLSAEEAANPKTVARDAAGLLPDAFTMDQVIEDDPLNPGRMHVIKARGAKPCVTEFRTLERFGRFALVECRPLSTRNHQIRVHLAAAGAPILNDKLYGVPAVKLLLSDLKRNYKGLGQEKPMIDGLVLHASEVVLKHPDTQEPVTLSAELPKDFTIALKYLRKFAPRR